jgi:hypothetical protein
MKKIRKSAFLHYLCTWYRIMDQILKEVNCVLSHNFQIDYLIDCNNSKVKNQVESHIEMLHQGEGYHIGLIQKMGGIWMEE